MYPLSNLVGETLIINQPSLMKREFELVSSKGVLATVIFPNLFSTRVVVKGFDHKWEIKSLSIWQKEIGIFKYGYQMPFAKYVSNFWKTKGTIQLPKGARLNCKTGQYKKNSRFFPQRGKRCLAILTNLFSKEEQRLQ